MEEFKLPKKWYIVVTYENIDFCKSLKNFELNFREDFDYVIGGYYSKLNKCPGMFDNSDIIREGWKEITFEQFQEHVLGIKTTFTKEESKRLTELLIKLGIT